MAHLKSCLRCTLPVNISVFQNINHSGLPTKTLNENSLACVTDKYIEFYTVILTFIYSYGTNITLLWFPRFGGNPDETWLYPLPTSSKIIHSTAGSSCNTFFNDSGNWLANIHFAKANNSSLVYTNRCLVSSTSAVEISSNKKKKSYPCSSYTTQELSAWVG